MAIVRTQPPPGVTPARVGPGQESVWDYPRPPRVESTDSDIVVRAGDVTIAATKRALRVLEMSLAPSYYIPLDDVQMEHLEPAPGRTVCEWKGTANYFDVAFGDGRIPRAAWIYPGPKHPYDTLAGCVSFYPDLVECTVDGEKARAHEGGFYGGWITSRVAGPFKGGAGTLHW